MARSLTVLGGQGSDVAPTGRRERADARENRVRILAAARELMQRGPLDALCMDEVAALAGVGKGTLYRRFADKAALLRGLLDDSERALQDQVQSGFARRQRAPRDALVWLLDLLFGFVVDHAPVLAAVAASARGAGWLDAPPNAWRRAIIVAQLERAGVTDRGRAVLHAEMLLASMSAEVVQRSLEARAPDEVRAQARQFLLACIDGALAADARPPSPVPSSPRESLSNDVAPRVAALDDAASAQQRRRGPE